MEFRILGPLEVVKGGQPLALGVPKQRALLAVLLLHANETVSRERLIDELWGEEPPTSAPKLVQHYVSGLRKVLPADVLVTRAPGYALRVEPGQLDLSEFQRLVDDARAAAAEGEIAHGADAYRSALSLWRGPVLGDVELAGQARHEAEGIDELHVATLIERMELDLQLGRHAELVGELETLVERHPYKERLRGQLMLALYRSGRQTEALETYHATRRVLIELGLEPNQDLQRLERGILQQDPLLELPEAARAAPAASAPEPARPPHLKTVTIVVCAPTAASGDPEAFGRALSGAFAVLFAAAAYHGGQAERLAGGEVMAVFGVPEAHEDDALRALRAAAQVRDALGGEVKIGLATGRVLADAIGVTGEPVGEAARLAASTPPGEIVAAEATLELAGTGVETDGARVVRISDVGPALPDRTEASIVGRSAELERLHARFDSVVEERRCDVVTIVGDAGVGKSRLVRELVARLGDAAAVLVGHCPSYGEGATYLPLLEALRDVDLGGTLAGSDDTELVSRRLAELTGEAEGTSSSGEAFWAVRRVLEALARKRPLVLVLEDVHWAEPTLLDLVDYLVEFSADAPLLILCLARPELPPRPAWVGAPPLPLEPLSAEDSQVLVAALGSALDAESRTRIAQLAEGNPLYAEQLAALAEDAGEDALEGIPPTIEALLASRLDRLAADERAVLERAAVVGREFSHTAVVHLAPTEEVGAVGRHLLALARRGLVRPGRAPTSPGDTFRFHHVLVREAANASIPKEARAELHERHADWLEQEEADDVIVGYHLEQAYRLRSELGAKDGRSRRLANAAGERLSRAGIRAWRVGDAPAAKNLLGRAKELLPADHPARGAAVRELGWALWALGEGERADALFSEAVERASAAGDRPAELQARLDLAYRGLFSEPEGRAEEILDIAAEAIPLFEALGDHLSLGRTELTVAYVHGGWHSHHAAALRAAESALVNYRAHGWVAPACVRDIAASLYYGPMPVHEAIRRCDELLADADLAGGAEVETYLAGMEAMDGRLEGARDRVVRAREVLDELGWAVTVSTTWAPVAAAVEVLAGDLDTAARLLRESCFALEELDNRGSLAPQAGRLGLLLSARGRLEEAERWATTAERSAAPGDVPAQLEWRTARASLLAKHGALSEAETLAREAVLLGEDTDALNRRADVALVLAEVLRLAGRADEANEWVENAIALYERKGNAAGAKVARVRLGEPAPA